MSEKTIIENSLESANIDSFMFQGEKYYSVEKIRMYFPYFKFNTDKIVEYDDIRGVRAVDVLPMTEFDINILKHRFKK